VHVTPGVLLQVVHNLLDSGTSSAIILTILLMPITGTVFTKSYKMGPVDGTGPGRAPHESHAGRSA